MDITKQIEDLVEDQDRASTLQAEELVLKAIVGCPRSPELDAAIFTVARSLYETAETQEEGVDALRFLMKNSGPNAAANLLEDLDGSDAVQRIHLVLIAEESDGDFATLYPAISSTAPVKRRLYTQMRKCERGER